MLSKPVEEAKESGRKTLGFKSPQPRSRLTSLIAPQPTTEALVNTILDADQPQQNKEEALSKISIEHVAKLTASKVIREQDLFKSVLQCTLQQVACNSAAAFELLHKMHQNAFLRPFVQVPQIIEYCVAQACQIENGADLIRRLFESNKQIIDVITRQQDAANLLANLWQHPQFQEPSVLAYLIQHKKPNEVAFLMSKVKPPPSMIGSIDPEVACTFLNKVTITNEFVDELRQSVMCFEPEDEEDDCPSPMPLACQSHRAVSKFTEFDVQTPSQTIYTVQEVS